MHLDPKSISLYKSMDSVCSYLPDRQSASLFANPYDPPSQSLYNHLIQVGFRRSGDLIYRPDCELCCQCISVRLRVCEFVLRRRFRRILNKNRTMKTVVAEPKITDEYFDLYLRYLKHRHPGGSMEASGEEDFTSFLVSRWNKSLFLEMRLNDRLIAVAVTDILMNGLSSVYTFFDPEESSRSPGYHAIVQQIELTRQNALPYLYLGYWIGDSPKMSYKADFQPLEYFYKNRWRLRGELESILSNAASHSKAS